MPYTGPDWTEFSIEDRGHVRREFDPPHPMTGHRVAEWSGRIVKDVSQYGFTPTRDDIGGRGFHAWDPGETCHQKVTRLPPQKPHS